MGGFVDRILGGDMTFAALKPLPELEPAYLQVVAVAVAVAVVVVVVVAAAAAAAAAAAVVSSGSSTPWSLGGDDEEPAA
eukprot:scaffold35390_cov48-Phaeocystis_antarctica.AAC.1